MVVGLKMPLMRRGQTAQAALKHEFDIIKTCGDRGQVVRVFGWCLVVSDEGQPGNVKSIMMEYLPLGE